MRSFFDPENGLFSTLALMVDIVGLSLLWLLLCLPVVTVGPATAALYRAVVGRGEGDKATFAHMLRSFRDNWKQGILLTVPCELLTVLLFLGWQIMFANQWASTAAAVLHGVYCVALVVPAGFFCWLFPLMGRFSFQTGALVRTAAQLSLIHLPTTLVVVVLAFGGLLFSLVKWWAFALLPVALVWIQSLLMERAFRKYLPSDPRALPD